MAQTAGAIASGWSAAATGRAGEMAAEHGDPLEAAEGNPAGLGTLDGRALEAGGFGSLASGSFRNTVDTHGHLSGTAGAIPYGAFGARLGASAWRAGVAVTPDALIRAKWRYVDPPGTAGASYGLQTNQSEILAIRTSAGLAWSHGSPDARNWALGGTVGLVYNTNTLRAPFIFQQQPQLAGLKVLLDLHTAGFGWNGSAGAQWQPGPRLRFGAAWKSSTAVQSHGDASGTASAQFTALGIAADPAFHYRAEVDNRLPQVAAGAISWQQKHVRLVAEGDWTHWHGAFATLPVKLKDGTNPTINSVAGSSAIRDGVPLNWRNQGIARGALEAPLGPRWILRGGYAYQSDPVPGATLTPVTAAILQHLIAAGAGWRSGFWTTDFAYSAQLPASRTVGISGLRAGEYNGSRVSVSIQSFTATVRRSF